MSFVSLKFFALFLILYTVYWSIQSNKIKRILILLGSILFYSFFSTKYLLHLGLVIFINHFIIQKFSVHRHFLKFLVGFNLANLALFKYFYFGLSLIGNALGIEFLTSEVRMNQYFSSLSGIQNFEFVLPATISYYTFQLISLGVDIKNKKIVQIPSLYDVASYILFFPVMIAGPILRYNEIRPQIDDPKMSKDDLLNGLWLLTTGVFKKTLLSDTLSAIIYPVFAKPEDYSGFSLLLTSYFFAIHLYLDFSGLTDMARGIAQLLGYKLPENFKAPFFIQSFAEFWKRWHITFSNWIRDYIFIPLGGSRCSEFRIGINLLITFSLGGLWHGASLNYALWGLLTGIFLFVERQLEIRKINIVPEVPYIKPIIKYIFVIHIYMISWVLFFTRDVRNGFTVMYNIVSFQNGIELKSLETGFYILFFALLFHLASEYPERAERFSSYKKYILPVYSLIVLLAVIVNSSSNMDFFYSKF